MVQPGDAPGPLAGLAVVETAGEIAVRYCGRLFAALGAEVIQVASHAPEQDERPAARAFQAWLDQGKTAAPDLASALAALEGRTRPLVIAGQTPAMVGAVDEIIRGLGVDAVRLALTWFGEVGPYAGWRGHDAVIHALDGLAFGFGLPEGPPIIPQGHAPQLLAGVVGLTGALAALMGGEAGSRQVDVNVLEAALCFMEMGTVSAVAMPEYRSARNGINRYSPTCPSSIYATADGWVGLTALTPPQWRALCALMTEPDWAEAFAVFSSLERLAMADEIDAVLVPRFAERPSTYWIEAGARLRIPITPADRPRDLPDMPHWRARKAFAAVPGHAARAPTLPYRFSFDGRAEPRPAGGARGPLDGVRVADFSMGWAGPLAARYLADLGADVLKIESTQKPDWWRGWEVVEDQDPPLHELPRPFMAANREKRGLDLDLASPAGKAVAEAIVRSSDLVIENQGPGVMGRLGLGQTEQRRLRPGIVSITMPPFGLGGPLSGVRAYGSTVEQASGLPFANGCEDWPPSMQHVALGDPVAALYGAAVAMAALWGRERLGGADVDLCQVECLFQLGADAIIADQIEGLARDGGRRPGEAPVCIAAARGEEAWLALAVPDDAAWRALCGVLADESLSADWALAQRKAREPAIEAAIARWAASRAPAEAAEALQAAGVPAAPVLSADGLWRDPHLVQCGYWMTQQRRFVGEHLTPRPPFRFDGERPAVGRPAPTLGEHTEEVLAELGLELQAPRTIASTASP
jgi:crotonobetainyl-CoA:carnitine CoA-transferase CaiB-like acyl-CoA transferase